MCWTNSTSGSQTGGTAYTSDPAVVNGGLNANSVCAFLWCATARNMYKQLPGDDEYTAGLKSDLATRTDSNPYMVGLAERIEIQCNNGMPWQWRRICWRMKGGEGIPTMTSSFRTYINAQFGVGRVMNQVAGNPGSGDQYYLFHQIFKGQVGTDWNDPMTAPLDKQLITPCYDKVVTLSSGNEDGFIRAYKKWHPMKKTLAYNDFENGGTTLGGVYSTDGKRGMGDYYVLDLFRARQGSSASDQLTVRPTATLYWHEK